MEPNSFNDAEPASKRQRKVSACMTVCAAGGHSLQYSRTRRISYWHTVIVGDVKGRSYKLNAQSTSIESGIQAAPPVPNHTLAQLLCPLSHHLLLGTVYVKNSHTTLTLLDRSLGLLQVLQYLQPNYLFLQDQISRAPLGRGIHQHPIHHPVPAVVQLDIV